MACYLLVISYFGRGLSGSQRQKSLPTAQALIETALALTFKKKITVRPCSRLDKGVSALKWSVAFDSPAEISEEKMKKIINKALDPNLMAVLEARRVGEGFEPRKEAVLKTYLYTIDLGAGNPLADVFSWNPLYKAERERIKEKMKLFEGQHDFSSFFSKDKDEEEKPFLIIENISFADEGDFLKIRVTGRAFGRFQVRFMVGSAYLEALGRIKEGEIARRLNGEIKGNVKFKAPAEGLILEEVRYREEEKKKC
jgi:tRNA pseudouridine38-40 synthase